LAVSCCFFSAFFSDLGVFFVFVSLQLPDLFDIPKTLSNTARYFFFLKTSLSGFVNDRCISPSYVFNRVLGGSGGGFSFIINLDLKK